MKTEIQENNRVKNQEKDSAQNRGNDKEEKQAQTQRNLVIKKKIENEFTIISNKKIAAGIFEMQLKGTCPDLNSSGKFINIKIDGFYLRRPISICDYSDGELMIIYKVLGNGTEALSKMREGEKIFALGALGNGFDISSIACARPDNSAANSARADYGNGAVGFARESLADAGGDGLGAGEGMAVVNGMKSQCDGAADTDARGIYACATRPLLVGGGVGTPPMYGLCKRLIEVGAEPIVILGFNSKEDVFYQEKFETLGAKVFVTTVDGSYGIKGFVTDAIDVAFGSVADSVVCGHDVQSDSEFNLTQYGGHESSADAGIKASSTRTQCMPCSNFDYLYACGPIPMLKALYDKTTCHGQFSFEERMACGFGACMGCSTKVNGGEKRICVDGPVLFREEINWG